MALTAPADLEPRIAKLETQVKAIVDGLRILESMLTMQRDFLLKTCEARKTQYKQVISKNYEITNKRGVMSAYIDSLQRMQAADSKDPAA